MLDKALILRKISELEECTEQLKEYTDITADEYCGNWKIQRIVERTLQMMIEICIDIASHIISDGGYRVPQGYADTFRVLYDQNILSKELFAVMEKMAKFRNIIVHHYDHVDEVIVVDILRKHLADFLAYKDAIINTILQE